MLSEIENELIEAVKRGDCIAVKRLLHSDGAGRQGVNPNIQDSDETPVLSLAVKHETAALELVNVLLAADADASQVNKKGSTPFALAAEVGNVDVMDYLFKNGANGDVTRPNNTGNTPTLLAAMQGSKPALYWLSIHGAEDDVTRSNKAGCTPTTAAALKGHCDILDWLLAHGAKNDVTRPDNLGMTPMRYAATHGSITGLEWLFANGAKDDVCRPDKDGITPLFTAARNGHIQALAWLFDHGTSNDVTRPDNNGDTPLGMAARNGHIQALAWLFSHGAREDVTRAKNNGVTPLWIAAQEGHMKALDWLFDHGASNDVTRARDTGVTPLWIAAQNSHMEVLDWLYDHGAKTDVNRASARDATPLWKASANGDEKVVDWLLKHGARLDDSDPAGPLMTAARKGHTAVVAKLLKIPGIDVNAADKYGMTALWMALQYHKNEVLQQLLQAPGIDVNQTGGPDNDTIPLWAAIKYNNFDGVKALINAGSGLSIRPGTDWYALQFAISENQTEISKWLIAHGAQGGNVTEADGDGRTPLWLAVYKAAGNIDILDCLYLHGAQADVNRADTEGISPLWRAAVNGDERVVDWLLKHGAQLNDRAKFGVAGPLIAAATKNHTAVVTRLLQIPGIDVNAIDAIDDGVNALYMALGQGHNDVVQQLLQASGIDVNFPCGPSDSKRTPLFAAVEANNFDGVKALVEAGADLLCILGTNVDAQHTAAYLNLTEMAEYLLERKRHKKIKRVAESMIDHYKLRSDPVARKQFEIYVHHQRARGTIDADVERVYGEIFQILHNKMQIQEAQDDASVQQLPIQFERMEREHAKLMEQYHRTQVRSEAEHYLSSNDLIRTFYFHLQTKLTELFLAYKVISSGLVVRERTTTEQVVSKTITLLGGILPLPGVNLLTQAIEAGVAHGLNRAQMKKFTFLSTLLRNLSVLDEAVQAGSRLLTFKYEDQIIKLNGKESARKLAEGVVARFIALMNSEAFNESESLAVQLGSIVSSSSLHQRSSWLAGMLSAVLSDRGAWTIEGIFQKTGIKTENGNLYGGRTCNTATYGYRLGTIKEVRRLELTQEGHSDQPHPLYLNPFRWTEDATQSAEENLHGGAASSREFSMDAGFFGNSSRRHQDGRRRKEATSARTPLLSQLPKDGENNLCCSLV